MIKRGHIRQFLAVVDAGTFTKAAARIHITQPTLSAGIADFEKLIGSPLFVRERKKVRLTETGARLLAIARRLEGDFRLLDGLEAPPAPKRPAVSLGVLRTIPGQVFRDVLDALSRTMDVEMIDGSGSELRAQLARGKIQLALTLVSRDENDDTIVPLLDEPYRMMVSAAHRLATCECVAPMELAGEVMIARRACEALQATSHFFTANGVRPRFAYRSDDDERCMAMVAAGVGITTAPLSMAVAGTVPIRVAGYELTRTIGLVGERQWLEDSQSRSVFRSVAALMDDVFIPAA